MARCPHNNVQSFTECCLDCGRNIYETDKEYLQYLKQLKELKSYSEIEKLEIELGIKHPGNTNENRARY